MRTALIIAAAIATTLVAATIASAHESHFHHDLDVNSDLASWQGRARRLESQHVSDRAHIGRVVAESQYEFLSPLGGPTAAVNNKSCTSCLSAMDIVFKLLNTSAGVNMTIGIVVKDVCPKLKKAVEQELCKKLAPTILKLLGKLDPKATSQGWDISRLLCADIAKKCWWPCCTSAAAPEQLWLNFASPEMHAARTNYTISWVTLAKYGDAQAQYRVQGSRLPASVSTALFKTYHQENWIGYSNGATILNVPANATIEYRVGSPSTPGGMSAWHTFKTLPMNIGSEAAPLNVVWIADIGAYESANTMLRISDLADRGQVDFVFIGGDLSYANGDGGKWDVFMREMSAAVCSRVACPVIDGNHEMTLYAGASYKARFWNMPAERAVSSDALYYAFQVGPLSMVVLDSETPIDTPDIDAAQRAWAKPVLEAANARTGTFLMVQHHRPLYCSKHSMDCSGLFAKILRAQVEQLYNDNAVDAVFAGHIHNQETTYPMRNGTLVSTNYTFPTAPSYVINGAGGRLEGMARFSRPVAPWSRFRSETIGYQTLQFVQKKRTQLDGEVHTSMRSTYYLSATNAALDEFELVSKR